jgi:hypothetical protein
VTVEVLGVANTDAVIVQVTDIKTGSVNGLLTPNLNLKIAGKRIKVAGDSAANGIYFVNRTSSERIKVNDSDIVTNKPSEVIIVIPPLEAGTYLLEITSQFGRNKKTMLKEPRTAIFDKELTVE